MNDRLMEIIGSMSHFECAVISPDLSFQKVSLGFWEILGKPEPEYRVSQIADTLTEFAGMEDILVSILEGTQARLLIENVNYPIVSNGVRYLDFSIVPLLETEPSQGLFLIVEDVSTRTRLRQELIQDRNELRIKRLDLERTNKELEQLSRYKSMILSLAAHDLRNPITVISIYTDIIKEYLPEETPEKVSQILEIIRSQCISMENLLTSLLDMEQMDQDGFLVETEKFLINDLIITQVNAIKLGDRDQHEFEVFLPEEDLLVDAAPNHLERVLYNLLINAVNYSPKNGIIKVSAWKSGSEVVFEVSNTGPGISEDELPKLFDIFYRAEKDSSQKVKGFGLGLFIVKSFVDAHQGRIEVSSTPGEWTTFTVTMTAISS